MPSDGWSKRFDEPIALDDGTKLTTLREAVEYLGKTVPKAEHDHPKVLNAADHLTRSAEQNYPMFFARAETLQAIHRNRERGVQSRSQGPPLGQAKAEARPIAEEVENRLVLRNTTTWDGTMALTIFCWAAANLAVATVWVAYCLWPRRPSASDVPFAPTKSGD